MNLPWVQQKSAVLRQGGLRFSAALLHGIQVGCAAPIVTVAGEESAVVDLLQLHAVVVNHAVGGDRAAAVFDELPCRSLAVQFVQLIHTCAAAVQVHVVVTANSVEVGKVGNDRGLLAAEGQVDEILQLE